MRRLALMLVFLFLTGCSPEQGERAIAGGQPAVGDVTEALVTRPAPATVLTTTRAASKPANPPPGHGKTGAPLPILAWDDERNHPVLRAMDPANGQDAAGYDPIALAGERDMAYWTSLAFSPDGRRLALFERSGQFCRPTGGGTACGPRSESLWIVDLAAWSAVATQLPVSGWSGLLAFSPDNSTLLASVEGERETSLYLIDVVKGDVLSTTVPPVTPTLLGFTGGGDEAIVLGQPPVAEPGVSRPEALRLLLLDSASLNTVWEKELPGVTAGHWCVEGCDESHERWTSALWAPGVVLSPDGNRLSIVHADEAVLTTVDLRGRAVREAPIEAARTWFDRLLALTSGIAHAKGAMDGASMSLALSPDGSVIYVAGETWTSGQTADGSFTVDVGALPLQVVDPSTGRITAESELVAPILRLSPDGRWLFLTDWGNNWPVTHILDAATLEPFREMTGPALHATWDVDGQPRIIGVQNLARDTEFTLYDMDTLDEIASWQVREPASALVKP